MPRQRPATSGYARLSQADEEDHLHDNEEFDDEDPYQAQRTISSSAPQYAPIQPRPQGHMHMPSDGSSVGQRRPGRRRKRERANSGVDIKAINARLERWAEEIASKFKIHRVKGKSRAEEHLEIHHSVFQAPPGVQPISAETLHAEEEEVGGRMTKAQFDDVVESVQTAIELGVNPTMISQGSSGSYFARNADGKVVGVFKPKDEEPYASRNPKWTKWIHRNLFPCFFGRACLIPNLSYVSEAAAYTLDSMLRTHIVPYTDIVHLSSRSFYYDFWQRSAFYRKRKPLPHKPGSFQVFLKGFKDANVFLRDNPWPDQASSGFHPEDAPRSSKPKVAENCFPGLGRRADEDESRPGTRPSSSSRPPSSRGGPGRFMWTDSLQQAFREELEKLVILDYIMRNTDRGLDNWMVKIDQETQQVSIVAEAPKLGTDQEPQAHPIPVRNNSTQEPYRRQEAMQANSRSGSRSPMPSVPLPAGLSIGAIDNSLSWPWKHPDAWRSFPFGWLFLPVSLIGQPFSQKTRDHFLSLLTSRDWWSETQVALRHVFEQDSDFKERMFARQIAVMKGQAWNVVETLKTPDHGPLELTRRTRVCVWDELVDIPVAIPLRSPSAELRRQQSLPSRSPAMDEEMDIGIAANGTSSARAPSDLSKLSPSSAEQTYPSRFEVSRNPSGTELGQMYEQPTTPATIYGEPLAHGIERKDFLNGGVAGRPEAQRSATTVKPPRLSGNWRRRQSFSRRYADTPLMYDGDDAEGDLGYAAATGTEKNTRKVIVERLEAVKSRNPVFTWC